MGREGWARVKYYSFPRFDAPRFDAPHFDAPPLRFCARCHARLTWPLYWIDVRTLERTCDACAFADEEGAEEDIP